MVPKRELGNQDSKPAHCLLLTAPFPSKYATIAAARAGMVKAAGSIRGVRPYSANVAVVMGPMEATVARAASS